MDGLKLLSGDYTNWDGGTPNAAGSFANFFSMCAFIVLKNFSHAVLFIVGAVSP